MDEGTVAKQNPPKQQTVPSLVIVLDNIRSGHNVGAAFRIADALGIHHLYLCGITPTPPHREIRKTALGAEHTVPWTHTTTVIQALVPLQAQGYTCVCIEQTHTSQSLHHAFQHPRHTRTALVFGHEVWGISQEALALAHASFEIPQHGKKKSLNVATCIAIAAWEWRKEK